MPQIPIPVGQQSALSIPELKVRATGDAFGANIARAQYVGARRVGDAQLDAIQAENRMWNTLGQGVIKIVGEQLQKDWRLEAEANINRLQLDQSRAAEQREATGDGSYTRTLLESFDERGRELVEGAASPFQANIYREGLQRSRFNLERGAIAQEAAAVRANRLNQANELTEAAEVEAFRDPGRLEEIRNRTIATLNASAIPPRQRQQLIEQFERRLTAQVIESHIIAGRLGAARAMLGNDETVKALGGLESVRMQARVEAAGREIAEREAGARLLGEVAAGTARLDPYSREHRELLNEAWQRLGVDRQLAASDQNAAVAMANVARTYGIAPQAGLSILNGMSANGTPEQQAFALQTLAMVEAAHPGILANSGANERVRHEADAFRFWTVEQGITPDDAVQRIAKTRTAEHRAAHEARKTEANRLVTNRTEAELAHAFNRNWLTWDAAVGSDPRMRDIVMSAYQRAFRFHYEAIGDEEQAISMALADMRRTYGLTRISGAPGVASEGRLMRNPVELRVPAVNESYEWVADDLDAFVERHAGRKVPREHRYYESVRDTDVSLSRLEGPVYAVSWFDPATSTWHQAPELWRPNYGAAIERTGTAVVTARERTRRIENDAWVPPLMDIEALERAQARERERARRPPPEPVEEIHRPRLME